jgi:alpha-tubulin suppressor-like RCC1 family protein
MAVTGPPTGFLVTDPNTGNTQDLGNRYVSKSYLLDVYPNMVPGRTVPGLWACGYNTLGQLGNGTVVNYSSPIQIGSLTNWKQVVCGGTRSHAIKTDGTLWSWGGNREGEIGNGTSITTYSSPIQVGLLTNWKQVAAGNQVNSLSGGDFFSQTLAVKTDGTLWAWGNNGYGALGNGTTTPYSSPIQIGALTNWKQVACGYATFAIKTDGTLWAWGYNLVGGLGNGNTVSYSSPIQIGSLTNWKQVAAAFDNSYFISAAELPFTADPS